MEKRTAVILLLSITFQSIFCNEPSTNFLSKLGYTTLKNTCLNSSFLAKSPAVHKFVESNFGILTGIVSALSIFCCYKLAMKAKRQYTDNIFIQTYQDATSDDERSNIMVKALMRYSVDLKEIWRKNESNAHRQVYINEYSKPVLNVELITNDQHPLTLRITNHLDPESQPIEFVTPFTTLNKLNKNFYDLYRTLLAPYIALKPGANEVKHTTIYAKKKSDLSQDSKKRYLQVIDDNYKPGDIWIGLFSETNVKTNIKTKTMTFGATKNTTSNQSNLLPKPLSEEPQVLYVDFDSDNDSDSD